MDNPGILYESRTLPRVQVTDPDGDSRNFAEVRIRVLAGGIIVVYRERSFSGAAALEQLFPAGSRYESI